MSFLQTMNKFLTTGLIDHGTDATANQKKLVYAPTINKTTVDQIVWKLSGQLLSRNEIF